MLAVAGHWRFVMASTSTAQPRYMVDVLVAVTWYVRPPIVALPVIGRRVIRGPRPRGRRQVSVMRPASVEVKVRAARSHRRRSKVNWSWPAAYVHPVLRKYQTYCAIGSCGYHGIARGGPGATGPFGAKGIRRA